MSATHIRPGDPLADLTAERRQRDLDALRHGSVDVLVIGGGITGCGVALDAASRGLSVALVESHDLAFGTSRWSSKLVHGGLRYLASGQVGIAWESAVERAHLLRTIAPHLVHPVPQVVPLLDDTSTGDAAITRLGFAIGGGLKRAARTPGLARARRIDADETLRLLPCLDRSRVRGGLLNWDGQLEDDARLVVAVARTAAAYGARIVTGVRVESASRGGARCVDTSTGESFEVRAREVVNATGVWAGDLDSSVSVTPSRGTHLVIRSDRLGDAQGSLTVKSATGRYVFTLPHPDGITLVGLTDVEAPGRPVDEPIPSEDETDWLLGVISEPLAQPLTRSDVIGSFAGLRPLVSDDASTSTADISRKHLVRRNDDGVITVTGGKLTTYRRMAQDAVDLVTDRPCRTTDIPLVGAGAVPSGLPPRLVRRYGAEAGVVASYAADQPSLLQPLSPSVPVLGVEIVHAVAREGARLLDDVLSRRTRISLVPADAARVADRVREIAGLS